MKHRRGYIYLLAMLGGLLLFSLACRVQFSKPVEGQATASPLKMAPLIEMPVYVKQAAPEVQEAYRFAVANREVLEKIPCYCGCNQVGHQNNYQCYVAEDGRILEFDNHAAF